MFNSFADVVPSMSTFLITFAFLITFNNFCLNEISDYDKNFCLQTVLLNANLFLKMYQGLLALFMMQTTAF